MAHPLRSGSIRHSALALTALTTLAVACASQKKDGTPPTFAGVQSASIFQKGTAHLEWHVATDASLPITYLVYVADGSGAENFDAPPAAMTQGTSLDIAGLPVSMRASYFVVRASDARGNVDTNVIEQSVTFASNLLSFKANIPKPHYSTGDIAVNSAGNLVAMGGFISSPQVRAYVFDVSTADNPVEIATLYGPGRSTDLEIRGDLLYVSTEEDSTTPPSGVYIYDLSNPGAISQTPISSIHGPGLGQCHTVWLEGTILYCASSDDGFIHLVDVTDPLNPVALSKVGFPGDRIHDMYVKDGFAVGCFLWDGWAFFDVSDPLHPVLQQRVQYTGAFTHNAWPTDDLHYLYTTDETTNGHLRIWDIQDRDHVTEVGSFIADPGHAAHAIVHNVQIVGGLAWVSWYEAGAQVLDITDPVHPTLIGAFDTWQTATTGDFEGNWGVAPKPPMLYLSDLDTGLYVLKLKAAQ